MERLAYEAEISAGVGGGGIGAAGSFGVTAGGGGSCVESARAAVRNVAPCSSFQRISSLEPSWALASWSTEATAEAMLLVLKEVTSEADCCW